MQYNTYLPTAHDFVKHAANLQPPKENFWRSVNIASRR